MAKKKGPLVGIIILLVALLVLAVTNPGDKDFKAYLSAQGSASAQRNAPKIFKDAADVLGGAGGSLMSLTYKRRNILFFSVFTPNDAIGDKTYIGCLKKLFIGF